MLSVIVVVSSIAMLVTKRFEIMIYYILLLGGFTLFIGIRDVRKEEVDFSTYMNITIFGFGLHYFFNGTKLTGAILEAGFAPLSTIGPDIGIKLIGEDINNEINERCNTKTLRNK